MDLKEPENRWRRNIQRASFKIDDTTVLDAKTIEDMVADILAEGFRAGQVASVRGEPRKRKHFRFDVPLLQRKAKEHREKEGLAWLQVSDATGLGVAPLKQHLGDTPPKEMGLSVAISLLAWLGEFDLLGYLLED